MREVSASSRQQIFVDTHVCSLVRVDDLLGQPMTTKTTYLEIGNVSSNVIPAVSLSA
jgi:hypothetical protein